MYLNTYGGSALLHLLMGYPRLILIFGLAGTVAMVNTPHGPGRYVGSDRYIAQLDEAFKNRPLDADAEARAQQNATAMLERFEPTEIRAAVEQTLRECGPGCTDLAMPIVVDDPELLRRILVLYQLDQHGAKLAAAAAATLKRSARR